MKYPEKNIVKPPVFKMLEEWVDGPLGYSTSPSHPPAGPVTVIQLKLNSI